MKNLIILLTLAVTGFAFAPNAGKKYFTKTGNISFFSATDMENIEAQNHKVTSAFETASGKIQFSVLMKAFEFEKALMQEHFNENYVESDKYPKSSFDGIIENVSEINFAKDGTYKAKVSGNLTIKDRTNKVSTTGTFTVKGTDVTGNAVFKIKLVDYNISVPSVVKKNISEEIEIRVNMNYKPM